MKWGDRYYAPPEGPPRIVRHRGCGGEVTGQLTCERCGRTLTAREVFTEARPRRLGAGAQRRPLSAPSSNSIERSS